MRGVWLLSLAQLRVHKGRYVSCGAAVAIAVMFIVVTGVVGASVREQLSERLSARFATSDVVVAAPADRVATLADQIVRIPGVAGVATDTQIPVRVGTAGHTPQPMVVTELADPGPLRWQELAEGQWPSAPNQVVVEKDSPFRVGSTVQISSTGSQSSGAGQSATVVGTVARSDPLGPPTVFSSRLLATELGAAPSAYAEPATLRISYDAGSARGATAAAIGVAAAKVKGAEVLSPQQAATKAAGPINAIVNMLTGALLVFAAITVLVAALVIANTFAVLVSSRVGELAMLRCIGADALMVRRLVRTEAAVLGAAASVVGMAMGLAVAWLALIGLGAFSPEFSGANLAVPLWVPLVAATVGIGMAVVSASGPARATSRVSPVAACAPSVGVSPRSRAGMAQAAGAVAVMCGGVAALAVGAWNGSLVVATLGGMVTFVGFAVAARVLIPPLVRAVAMAAAKVLRRPVADLVAANSARYPRRTAATATALVVGIALTSMMVVGHAVTKSSARAGLDAHLPVDVIASGPGLSGAVPQQLAALDGVSGAVAISRVDVRVKNSPVPMEVALRGAFAQTVRSATGVPRPGQIAVSESDRTAANLALGEQISVDIPGSVPTTYTVVDGGNRSLLLTDAAVPQPPTTVAIRLDDHGDSAANGVVVQRIRDTVAQSAPAAEVTSAADARRELDTVLAGILMIGLALLAISLVVALFGVANTVALSVIDRRRENALLRVIGAQAATVRWMLVGEAGVCAAVASLVGVVMGSGFGLAGVAAIVGRRNLVMPTVAEFPWWAVGAIVVTGCVAGMASAVIPARRALAQAPVRALAIA